MKKRLVVAMLLCGVALTGCIKVEVSKPSDSKAVEISEDVVVSDNDEVAVGNKASGENEEAPSSEEASESVSESSSESLSESEESLTIEVVEPQTEQHNIMYHSGTVYNDNGIVVDVVKNSILIDMDEFEKFSSGGDHLDFETDDGYEGIILVAGNEIFDGVYNELRFICDTIVSGDLSDFDGGAVQYSEENGVVKLHASSEGMPMSIVACDKIIIVVTSDKDVTDRFEVTPWEYWD